MGNQFLIPNYTFFLNSNLSSPAVLLNMISVACNSRIPQAILQPGLLFKQVTIFQCMIYNSLADFTDKVTSKELLNITVPRMSALFFHRLPICERATGSQVYQGMQPSREETWAGPSVTAL